MRNPEYVQYGAASVSNQRDLDKGEAKFNALSLEERSKFKEETLVNVGGRTRRQRYSRCAPCSLTRLQTLSWPCGFGQCMLGQGVGFADGYCRLFSCMCAS